MVGWVTELWVIGKFGVSGVNENGDRIKVFCTNRSLCVSDIKIYISIHDRGKVQLKSMIDLVLFNYNYIKNVLDVKAVRFLSGCVSDHMVVVCRLCVCGLII